MKKYAEFCEHYELPPAAEDSREQYEEYRRQLRIFESTPPEDEAEPERIIKLTESQANSLQQLLNLGLETMENEGYSKDNIDDAENLIAEIEEQIREQEPPAPAPSM